MSFDQFEFFVSLILSRLECSFDSLSRQFASSISAVGVRYCVLDELLPSASALKISSVFPDAASMRLISSFREKKYTSKNFEKFDPLLGSITFALQDPRVVAIIEKITGINNQIPDPTLYAGGLSAMVNGHFLGPHIDNSHDSSRKYYRTLNLLYYVTPGWNLESGGNLELWDSTVRSNETIVSRFNRLVIMETTPISWHSVSEIRANNIRKCISNYYFSSQSPTNIDYSNVTFFSARPEQPFRRLLARVDGRLRHNLRKLVPTGLAKKDIYRRPKT